MLVRGLHSFLPRPEDHDHTLSFKSNDRLLFVETLKRDVNWIKVIDISGRIGYVPINFVQPDEFFDQRDTILSFLMDAIVAARRGNLPSRAHLEALRDEILDSSNTVDRLSKVMTKCFASAREGIQRKAHRSNSAMTATSTASSLVTHSKRHHNMRRINSETDVRNKPSRLSNYHSKSIRNKHAKQIDSDSSTQTAIDGTETEDYTLRGGGDTKRLPSKKTESIRSKLVSVVQESSGLDLQHSQNLLFDVFQQIKQCPGNLPLNSLLDDLAPPSVRQDDTGKELKAAIDIVSKRSKHAMKSGRTAIGSGIPPETITFSKELEKLSSTLIKCDPAEVGGILQADKYMFPQNLVQLYQLESPSSIKEKLLDIFLILCTGNRSVRSILLSTTLPLLMTRELMSGMRGNRIFKQQMDLLTSLLTSGDSMPDSHYGIMGTGFAHFILTEIEHAFNGTCESDWEYNKLPVDICAMINLVLAFNLQFSEATDNLVLRVLAEYRKRPLGFLSMVVQQLARTEDPLKQELEDNPNLTKSVPNSVVKMVRDLCLCQRTRAYLYGMEKQDLVKIVQSNLMKTAAGSVRLGCLQVLQALLLGNANGDLRGIRLALVNILLDTDPLAVSEQHLVRAISTQFPALFTHAIDQMQTDVGMGRGNSDGITGNGREDYFYLSS